MSEPVDLNFRKRITSQAAGLFGLGIALAGAGLFAVSVYLCCYSYIEEFAKTSWPVITAGVGLIGAFCILATALIAGIRAIIIRQGHIFCPVLTIIISLPSLLSLVGLSILGFIS